MFIGLIKDTGVAAQTEPELIIKVNSIFAAEIEVGSHLAVNGIVLRVSAKDEANRLTFHKSNLNKSTNYLIRERVNLEPAVRLGEEIPGTFFYGIPTGTVELVAKDSLADGGLSIQVSLADNLTNYLSVKDIACLNGIFMQIVDLGNRLLSFNVYPNTLKVTNIGEKQIGDKLNIEFDPIVVKVARIMQKFNLKK